MFRFIWAIGSGELIKIIVKILEQVLYYFECKFNDSQTEDSELTSLNEKDRKKNLHLKHT